MIIAVDFDGTCVTHDYPNIGKEIGAGPVLRELVAAGHLIILWTMRSGTQLDQAAQWMAENGVVPYGVNTNPSQGSWTQSPKAYAQLYIDDAALGAPLTRKFQGQEIHHRPFIDWIVVLNTLVSDGIITEEAWKRAIDLNKLVPAGVQPYPA